MTLAAKAYLGPVHMEVGEGGGGGQVGEVSRLGGVTNLSIQPLFFFLTDFT